MAILLHGTTRHRAEHLSNAGPDLTAGEFSYEPPAFFMYREGCRYDLGSPEEYAERKAANFPEEGGPVILAVDVPEAVIAIALDEFYTWQQGIVPFMPGRGFEELFAEWPQFTKEIRPVTPP